jgi:hypothetical protein
MASCDTRQLNSEEKITLKRGIRQDLRKARKGASGYDSFDEMWIVDNIKSEDKVYYGSDDDISQINSEISVSDTENESGSDIEVI